MVLDTPSNLALGAHPSSEYPTPADILMDQPIDVSNAYQISPEYPPSELPLAVVVCAVLISFLRAGSLTLFVRSKGESHGFRLGVTFWICYGIRGIKRYVN